MISLEATAATAAANAANAVAAAERAAATAERAASTIAVITERQTEMAKQVQQLRNDITKNNADTLSIKTTLDELTGAKKVLLWLTGAVAASASAIATYIGIHHK